MSSSTGPIPADIRDQFLADHRRIEALLERLFAAFEANERESMARLWDDFEQGLLAHLETEETYMIPFLQLTTERNARVVLDEHRHIRKRLTELGIALDLHTLRLETVHDFIDELRAHAKNEDVLLYRWADASLEPPHRATLLEAFTRRLHGRPRRAH